MASNDRVSQKRLWTSIMYAKKDLYSLTMKQVSKAEYFADRYTKWSNSKSPVIFKDLRTTFAESIGKLYTIFEPFEDVQNYEALYQKYVDRLKNPKWVQNAKETMKLFVDSSNAILELFKFDPIKKSSLPPGLTRTDFQEMVTVNLSSFRIDNLQHILLDRIILPQIRTAGEKLAPGARNKELADLAITIRDIVNYVYKGEVAHSVFDPDSKCSCDASWSVKGDAYLFTCACPDDGVVGTNMSCSQPFVLQLQAETPPEFKLPQEDKDNSSLKADSDFQISSLTELGKKYGEPDTKHEFDELYLPEYIKDDKQIAAEKTAKQNKLKEELERKEKVEREERETQGKSEKRRTGTQGKHRKKRKRTRGRDGKKRKRTRGRGEKKRQRKEGKKGKERKRTKGRSGK